MGEARTSTWPVTIILLEGVIHRELKMKINTVPSNKLPDVKLMNVPDDWNTSQEP